MTMMTVETTKTINQSCTSGLSYIACHLFFAVVTFLSAVAAYSFMQHDDGGMLETMAFYGVYHSDPINQIIHFIFVPCILWSAMIIMAHLPILPIMLPALPGIPPHSFTWATAVLLLYFVFYLTIDWIGCCFYFPFLYVMYASAIQLHKIDQTEAAKRSSTPSWMGTGRLIRRALLLHILGWYMQIHPGHKIFEGAQPAVLQSLGGALTSAPLFAYYEAVWAMGLRREMQQEVLIRVDKLRRELCLDGAQMRLCPTAFENSIHMVSSQIEL